MPATTYTSSTQALAAAELSASGALNAIKGALIQDRAVIGRNPRIVSTETDFALRQARRLVEQLEAARALVSTAEAKAA